MAQSNDGWGDVPRRSKGEMAEVATLLRTAALLCALPTLTVSCATQDLQWVGTDLIARTIDGQEVVGWVTSVADQDEDWPRIRQFSTLYYKNTGFIAEKNEVWDGTPISITRWFPDGRVHSQGKIRDVRAGSPLTTYSSNFDTKSAPPWWWDVKDQKEPDASWASR